jgi:hypothetical protein
MDLNRLMKDIRNQSPAYVCRLEDVLLLGNGGDATVGGYFARRDKVKTGDAFESKTIDAGDGSNDPMRWSDIVGAAVPADAVYVFFNTDIDLWWMADETDAADSELKTMYATAGQPLLRDDAGNWMGGGWQ